ncbi:MAG: DUF4405 domain-containing protein [Syntrophomonas sp.]
MNFKTSLKLFLDIMLTILFLILIDPKNTGFSFHEIAGLSIAALFSVHVVLNWKWVKSISKNLFSSKLKARPKLYYILNLISLVSVATIIFTGIEISRVLFASDGGTANHTYVLVHKWVSYFCLGLFGIHAALHWRFILNTARKWVDSLVKPGVFRPVLGLSSVVLVLGLVYSGIVANASEYTAAESRKEPPGLPSTVYQSSPSMPSSSSLSGQSPTPSSQTVNNSSSVNTQGPNSAVTLSEFLGNMFCSGCSKHCCLLSPQCAKGVQQVESAKIQYEQKYGEYAA